MTFRVDGLHAIVVTDREGVPVLKGNATCLHPCTESSKISNMQVYSSIVGNFFPELTPQFQNLVCFLKAKN